MKFKEALAKATDRLKVDLVHLVKTELRKRAAIREWQVSAWLLERLFPKDFARRRRPTERQ